MGWTETSGTHSERHFGSVVSASGGLELGSCEDKDDPGTLLSVRCRLVQGAPCGDRRLLVELDPGSNGSSEHDGRRGKPMATTCSTSQTQIPSRMLPYTAWN